MASGTEGRPPSLLDRNSVGASPASPRSGAAAAPVNLVLGSPPLSPGARGRSSSGRFVDRSRLSLGEQPVSQVSSSSLANSSTARASLNQASPRGSRPRSRSRGTESAFMNSPGSPATPGGRRTVASLHKSVSSPGNKSDSDASSALAKARARSALKENDSMVYLDGPQVYTCGQCRTHLTSHDDIISKSFHGRHGRAYLFDQCVNITVGPAEDRMLITGLHSVCDIFCKRCKAMIGWTYAKAYESSQKYKEGKFIIEKINLHLEESDYYDVSHPAGERPDRWRLRSMSWGSESSFTQSPRGELVYEYNPPSSASVVLSSPRSRERSSSLGGSSIGSPPLRVSSMRSGSQPGSPPAPPFL